MGLGLDFMGLYAYYLASPLNLLSVFVPENWLLGYFSLLMPIKLGFASLFFTIFLRKVFNRLNLSTSLFGCFYGLCAWALGYQWNIMWLDTFALLPLVMVGMLSLLKEKKFILYTITLFLSISINYYIGLFTCIFVLLCFICYQICRWQDFRTFFKDLCRIAVFSLLAITMTAILTVPTLAALQTTQSSVNSFPTTFQTNIVYEHNFLAVLKSMVKVAGNLSGGITPSFKEGLPNLYCGILTLVLSFMYLFCKQIRLRDKLCAVFLLLFFTLSFIIRQLDYIWHGFHFPNMIPHRFSFLYSFVMLYMAYSAWLNRKSFKLWQIITAIIISVVCLLCYEDLTELSFIGYNGAMILLYGAILVFRCIRPTVPTEDTDVQEYQKKLIRRRRLSSAALCGVMALELVLNLANFAIIFNSTSITDYPRGTVSTEDVLAHMKELEKDTPFYRAETSHTQTYNDGALNGYHGITTFTSSANVNTTKFMKAFGYGAKEGYNRYSFEESSPVANLFLDLKYMIVRDGRVEENPYFENVYGSGYVHLLKNNYHLPLGFLTNAQLLNVDFLAEENRFDFQNKLIQQSTGITDDVWRILPGTMLTINADGPTITPKPTTGYCAYTTEGDVTGTVTYSYTADESGFMCINLDLSKRNNFAFYHNGDELYSETYSLPQMLSVCQVGPGDVVEVEMKCKEDEKGTIKLTAAILDDEVFQRAYNILSESVLELTSFSNTQLDGTIDCQRDGVLYTSIPQNGNWSAIVDGKPAETVTIGGAMVGLLLSKGEHTIRFVYRNEALSLGWKISAASLLIFVVVCVVAYKPTNRRRKGKYER